MLERYMIKKPSVIIKVTNDKYQLPVEMADSVDEMVRLCGAKRSTIYKSLKRKNGQFVRVYLDEEEC